MTHTLISAGMFCLVVSSTTDVAAADSGYKDWWIPGKSTLQQPNTLTHGSCVCCLTCNEAAYSGYIPVLCRERAQSTHRLNDLEIEDAES
jgi:hypothetical protein